MKKLTFRPILVSLALSLSVPFMFGGCVAVLAAGAAGSAVAYVKGALTATLPDPLSEVQSAVKKVIRTDMKFTLISAKEDAAGAEYEARTARDEKVVIQLDRDTDKTTKISIRVGVFGDEDVSRQILEAIKTRLS
ncbi:MAG: DUF3568 family protein [Opitutales bacterium]|jgi:hypothetical protein